MSKLAEVAEVIVWGYGCETKPRIELRCEPVGGGAFVTIVAWGTYREPAEQRAERTENVLLDAMELDALLVVLTDPDLAGREPPARSPGTPADWLNSATGCVNMHLPLDSGLVEHMVDDREPRRLIALADFLLALAERVGITISAGFHPTCVLADRDP